MVLAVSRHCIWYRALAEHDESHAGRTKSSLEIEQHLLPSLSAGNIYGNLDGISLREPGKPASGRGCASLRLIFLVI
jgi:hypothetical protein